MTTNYPTALDDDSSLYQVVDNSSAVIAAHHNNLKDAVKALEAKVGIYNSGVGTSLDARLGHPTLGHDHNGASGHGPALAASAIFPSGAPAGFVTSHEVVTWYYQGSIPSGASLGPPLIIGRTLQLESIQAAVRRAPSGATLALDVNFGPTSIFTASVGYKPIMAAGTIGYQNASPNLVTYPSGAYIIVDADKVGTSEPGTDLSLVFVFRDNQ